MLKVYSKSCEYALRALAAIPLTSTGNTFVARDLCRRAKVPEASTRKAFQNLARYGLLIAVPGPGGGYRLAKKPEQITLYEFILGIDGDDAFDQCIMGLPSCHDRKPCPIHKSWTKMKSAMIVELKGKKLKDLMKAHTNT